MPPAPARFSISTRLPSWVSSWAASGRAKASVPPPAANGTTNVIGLSGHAGLGRIGGDGKARQNRQYGVAQGFLFHGVSLPDIASWSARWRRRDSLELQAANYRCRAWSRKWAIRTRKAGAYGRSARHRRCASNEAQNGRLACSFLPSLGQRGGTLWPPIYPLISPVSISYLLHSFEIAPANRRSITKHLHDRSR